MSVQDPTFRGSTGSTLPRSFSENDIHSIIKVSVTSLAECYQIEAVNMEKLLTMPSATLVLESWSCHPPITPSEQVNTRFKVKGASISRMTTSLS